MAYRIKNLIATLQRAPEPQYEGEILKLSKMYETWELLDHLFNDAAATEPEDLITLKAVKFTLDDTTWLDWVIYDRTI